MEFKLIALILLIHVSLGEAWENSYDGPVNFECHGNTLISRIVSQHDNHFEDRQWRYTCRNTPNGVTFTGCLWHNNVNRVDAEMNFRCRGNSVVTGVKSTHEEAQNDRIFSFKCCDLSIALKGCYQTAFINGWDAAMNYYLPTNYAMVGFYSIHQNYEEDRRWKVNLCEFP